MMHEFALHVKITHIQTIAEEQIFSWHLNDNQTHVCDNIIINLLSLGVVQCSFIFIASTPEYALLYVCKSIWKHVWCAAWDVIIMSLFLLLLFVLRHHDLNGYYRKPWCRGVYVRYIFICLYIYRRFTYRSVHFMLMNVTAENYNDEFSVMFNR